MMLVWSVFVVGSGIIYGNNTKANRVSATCDPMKRKYEVSSYKIWEFSEIIILTILEANDYSLRLLYMYIKPAPIALNVIILTSTVYMQD